MQFEIKSVILLSKEKVFLLNLRVGADSDSFALRRDTRRDDGVPCPGGILSQWVLSHSLNMHPSALRASRPLPGSL